MFNVGDKVVITKDGLEMYGIFSNDGTVYTIERIKVNLGENMYYLQGLSYPFNEGMIELAATPSEDADVIKDSGDRTLFSTGAVRDMHVGKGRCDLLPLDEVYKVLDYDDVIYWLSNYQDNQDTTYLKTALHMFCEKHYNDDLYDMILDVSIHFENGAKKYGEDNWRKGIPLYSYLDSGVRHYLKFMRGDKDERHDRAFVWNILCLMWGCDHV